ncbi:MAG TPA: TonB-dependent receptor [Novosphingobium sp.]|nr:TonB-dependent receptor [Novosphingobium sp.]
MRLYALLATTAAAALSATTAAAQTAQSAAAEPGLGDIVVTAQRKAESSQKAAIPLSVIDSATLIKAGITEASRLNELAPALSIEPTSTGNLIFMRGVGNFTVVATSDPAVAFNYDGVYIGRPTSTTGMFYDLERIEILKGPQGILYGRNATGGAINVLPAQPRLGELSGHLSATYGSYDTINAEGALNLPMGENGALRISASTSNHDGYLRDGTSDEKTTAFRVQMKAELTPNLTVRVSGDYAHNGGAGSGVSYYGRYALNPTVPISAAPVPGTNYYTFIPAGLPEGEGVYSPASQAYRQTVTFGPTGRRLEALAPYASANTDLYGAHAEITLKTGAGTLTVLPAWRYTSQDYVSQAAAFIFKNKESDEQYSLEARFAGDRVGIFDYTLGAYFYHEQIDAETAVTISNTGNAFVQTLGTKSYAGFGRIVANLSDRLRLVGGLRYTKDDKSFKFAGIGAVINCLGRTAFGAPNCPTAPFIPLFDRSAQFAFPFPAAGGAPIPVFTSPGPPNYLIIRTDTTFNRTQSNSRVTYRGALEFDVAPQSLLYASIETGYRSGGFAAAVGFETYNPEYITAYTIGMKNRFLDNRVQLNLEAFLWDYTDQQINHVGLDLNGRTANYTQNVGKSRIQGVEVEGRFLATPTTLISANVQYLDAKQKEFSYLAGPGAPPLTGCAVTFTAANASPYLVNCAGFTSYNSPKWTVNLAAQQTVPVGDFEFVAGVDTQYKGARPIGFAYLPQQQLDGNWTTNAQIQFGPADNSWSIAGYVRNIENNRTPIYSSTHPTAGFFINGTTAPRTYGVRAGIKF